MVAKGRNIFIALMMSVINIYAQSGSENYRIENGKLILTSIGAAHLVQLPLNCIDEELPYKPWYVIEDSSMATMPRNLHPAFYGCFDWHSSVHGHWLLVASLKKFPSMRESDTIRAKLKEHLSKENILKEVALFKGDNKSFERIYGWAWLLQLHRELLTWDDPLGNELSDNLYPLANYIAKSWIPFLSKLSYPVREPEHYNLAFGLCLTWDYAVITNNDSLKNAITEACTRFYLKDTNCPIGYEPGGYDFLSPCLEEADLMRRVLPQKQFQDWFEAFLPDLMIKTEQVLIPCEVRDPTDGKLVHLHGINLSRAWCLNGIAENLEPKYSQLLQRVAELHIVQSFPYVVSGHYAGDHWLATYAFYAMK